MESRDSGGLSIVSCFSVDSIWYVNKIIVNNVNKYSSINEEVHGKWPLKCLDLMTILYLSQK